MFYVYAIKNESNQIYIGQTSDLIKRLGRHNHILPSPAKSYTFKHKGIWKVFYQEEVGTRQEALYREKQLKSYQGRLFLKKLF
ncbi:MAG: GIY-YIG nuclease family protein [Candidatus Falkowbacteria bacterium]